jgi:hypothetical protein
MLSEQSSSMLPYRGTGQGFVTGWLPDRRRRTVRVAVLVAAVALTAAAVFWLPPAGLRAGAGAGATGSATPRQPAPTVDPLDTYANTAAFTNIAGGAMVNRCELVAGRADLVPTKTLLLAHRRSSPPSPTFYFFYVDNYVNGGVPPTWSSEVYFGSSDNSQRYDLYLLIMEVSAATSFWKAHVHHSGIYADALAIPATASVAVQLSVVQTGIADCE